MTEGRDLEVPRFPRAQRLRNRTAIVTGAGSAGPVPGTGAAMAILFATEGARVVIVDLDLVRAEHTAECIGQLGGTAAALQTDITDAASCKRATDFAMANFGRVDVLVNNAAIAPRDLVETEEMWQAILDVNLKGSRLMIEASIPHMVLGRGGSVIMISSIAASRGGAGLAYSASKAGMIGLAKAMAFRHGPLGVRFNCITPGHVAVPHGLDWDAGSDDGVNRRSLRTAAGMLGTEGTGWDIAYAALFLASDEARWITAATLPVDAGTSSAMPISMFPAMVKGGSARGLPDGI